MNGPSASSKSQLSNATNRDSLSIIVFLNGAFERGFGDRQVNRKTYKKTAAGITSLHVKAWYPSVGVSNQGLKFEIPSRAKTNAPSTRLFVRRVAHGCDAAALLAKKFGKLKSEILGGPSNLIVFEAQSQRVSWTNNCS